MVSKKLFTTQNAMAVLADKCPSVRKQSWKTRRTQERRGTELSVIPGNGAGHGNWTLDLCPEQFQNAIQVALGHLGEQGLVSNSLLVKNHAKPLSWENRGFPFPPQGTTRATSWAAESATAGQQAREGVPHCRPGHTAQGQLSQESFLGPQPISFHSLWSWHLKCKGTTGNSHFKIWTGVSGDLNRNCKDTLQ